MDLLIQCFFVDCLVDLKRIEPFTYRFFIKAIVKLYVILDVGREAAVGEMRKADKLKDEIKKSVTSSRGRFKESLAILTVGIWVARQVLELNWREGLTG